MRQTVKALAFLAALLPSLAAAQQPTLPPNTVLGRLGISPGPAQAIPFTTLSSRIGVLPPAKARMWPSSTQLVTDTVPWNAVDPWGTAIDCAGTRSQCLQEFFNAAATNGWPAEINCKGVNFPAGTELVYIQSSVSVTVPRAQNWSFRSYGCNLNFNVTTVPGLIIDSQGATDFDWDGLIIYNVTAPNGDVTVNPSCGVLIKPTTNTADGFASLYDGSLRIKSVAVSAGNNLSTATAAVCMDTNTGGIHNVVDFIELLGTGAGPSMPSTYYGLLIFGTHGAQGSRITVDHPHGMALAGVKNTTAVNPGGNLWTVNNCNPGGASSKCIWEFQSGNDWRLGSISSSEGGLQYGIYADTGACGNRFSFTNTTTPTTAAWADAGNCNTFLGPSGLVGYQNSVQNFISQTVGTGVGAGKLSPFIAQAAGQTGYAWNNTAGALDTKLWDCFLASSTIFQCRTVNDAQSVANAWLQVTRSGTTISTVQIGNGTTFATVPIGTNDTLMANALAATVTNKIMSGAANTFTNIGNASLTNSSVTYGTTAVALGASSTVIDGLTRVNLTSGSSINWNSDTFHGRAAAAKHLFGQADAAAPVAQTLSVQNVVAGTSNTAGAAFTIAGSQGTGTGLGGAINFSVAIPGSTGSTQNALVVGAALIPSSTAPGGMVWAQGVGPFVPWASSVAEWRTGTDQRFSLGGKNLLATGVAFNVFNDAITLNLGLEFRASVTGFTQGGVCIYTNSCTDPGTGNLGVGGTIKGGTTTVASLPTCNAAAKGTRYFVTDANSTTYHATAAGGGANNMGVLCDGTNWYLN